MEYIKSKDIFLLMRDILKLIHPRLMEHGSRVAYMVYMMLREEGKYEEFELADIVMTATMHDIGAYKTEAGRINDMLRYETKESMAHCIYGHLFFKYLSPLPDLAKVIMYHHMEYEQLQKVDYAYKQIAAYISIADRMDIYSNALGSQFDMHMFQKQAGTKFSSEGLFLFYNCEEKYGMFEKLRSGEYKEELDRIVEYMIFSNEDKKKFLEMLMYCMGFVSKSKVVDTLTTVCICEDIARDMMLPPSEREILYYGALIHDVGMLSIPREITDAPRKLEKEEIRLVRTHVDTARKILSNRMKKEVMDVALAHHERGDGSGYPLRLKDIQMNVPQRILQVADTVTALVNERKYRETLPKEKVVDILNDEASKGRLKRQVVVTFVRSYDRIMRRARQESAEILKMYETLNKQYEVISKKYKI